MMRRPLLVDGAHDEVLAASCSKGERRPKVLVVDDSDATRDLTVTILELEGFEVVQARSGTEALRLAGERPDLIILDVSLPDIDGFEVCRQIKAEPTTAAIPVLHLSGVRRESEDRIRGLTEGADAYLTRPLENLELVLTVKSLMRRGSSERSDADGQSRGHEAAQVLAEVSHRFAARQDFREATRGFVAAVHKLFRVRRVSFYELDRASRSLVCVAAIGDESPADWLGRVLPLGWGLTGRAVLETRPVSSTDIFTDPQLRVDEWLRERFRATGHGAALSVPLVARGEVLGALSLLDWRGRTFREDEVRLLSALADQAALALQNATLYTEADRRLQITRGVLAFARVLGTTLDVRELAQRAACETARLLGAETSWCIEIDTAAGTARTLAGYHVPPPLRALSSDIPLADLPPLFQEALQTGRPVASEDSAADPRLDHPVVRTLPILPRSILFAPVASDGRLHAALITCWWSAPRRFTEDEIQLAAGLASQVALSLDNARLHAETERRQRESEVVADLAQTINASLDLESILERVAAGARELCGCDIVRIALRAPRADDSVFRYVVALGDDERRSIVLEPGKGLGGQVLLTGRAARTKDYAADPGLSKDYLPQTLKAGVVALMAVPIRIGGRIEGLVYVGNRSARAFGDRDEALVEQLAHHAAVAIENARLFNEAQVRLTRTKRLAELSQQLSMPLDSSRALGLIAEAAQDLTAGDGARVWLLSPETGDLAVAAGSPGVGPDTAPPSPDEFSPQALVQGALAEILPTVSSGCAGAEHGALKNLDPAPHSVSQTAVPIVLGEQVVGALTIFAEEPRRFGDEDREVLQTLAAKAGSVVENERLVREAQGARDQLLQAQKMEAFGQLASGIAHDFNNILTVIEGRSELLLRRLQPADSSSREVEIIRESARRGTALTRQLLTFSRKQERTLKLLDLNAIVVRVMKMLERVLGEDIRVRIEADSEPALVEADPSQLEQVILNLAVNARDAMPNGGTLTIRTGCAVREAAPLAGVPVPPGRYAVLTVADTGCGMDARVRQRMFEPFFTTKEPGRGTGLGLATVYGIVKQSGGYIEVESELGRGTTFTISLPEAAGQPTNADSALAGRRQPNRGETILVVEHDERVRALARDVLERDGFAVVEAGTAGAALMACRSVETKIDLMLIGPALPKVTGPDLFRYLAELRPDMKIVHTSGLPGAALVDQASGVALETPVSPDALLLRVNEALGRS